MADVLPMLPRGRDRETQMLDEAIREVMADEEIAAHLEIISSRLGQRFTSGIAGPLDETTLAQLMHIEAKRALAHVMVWTPVHAMRAHDGADHYWRGVAQGSR